MTNQLRFVLRAWPRAARRTRLAGGVRRSSARSSAGSLGERLVDRRGSAIEVSIDRVIHSAARPVSEISMFDVVHCRAALR